MVRCRNRESEMRNMENRRTAYAPPTEASAMEYCIACHGDTGYTVDVPIQARHYYVEGCGQLCEDCYLAFSLQRD